MIGIRKNLKKALLGLAIGLALANAAHRLYHVCTHYTLDELIAHQRHK